jgi:hypothetical protein
VPAVSFLLARSGTPFSLGASRGLTTSLERSTLLHSKEGVIHFSSPERFGFLAERSEILQSRSVLSFWGRSPAVLKRYFSDPKHPNGGIRA